MEMITITNGNGYSISFTPASLKWSLQDVSAADSGRDQSGKMWKNTVAKKRKLELEFHGTDLTETANILKAVTDTEYFNVYYPDFLTGTYETRVYYVGDRETDVFTWWDNQKVMSSLTFNLIER